MDKLIKIAPSVLAAEFAQLPQQIKQVERGGADWLHIDVMDGHFVPNLTFGPLVISAIRKMTKLPLDTHLMIENPDAHLEAYAKAGCNHLTVHVETCPHLYRTVQTIKKLGLKAGVTLNPATPASVLTEIIPEVDIVLVMTVEPGYGGQEFIEGQILKIATIAEWISQWNPDCILEVDGGVNEQNTPHLVEAGATALVAGNALFKQTNIAKAVKSMKKIANEG